MPDRLECEVLQVQKERYYINKCKKMQFIHKLTATDKSKTAKITKKVITHQHISTSPKCQCAAE